jgi:hypothetical protein
VAKYLLIPSPAMIAIYGVYVCVLVAPVLVKSIRSGVMRFDRDGHFSISFRDRPMKFVFQFVLLSIVTVLGFVFLGVMFIFYYLDVVNRLNGAQ